MHRDTALAPEVWERIPPEAQASIRALQARVGAWEETGQRVHATSRQVEATVHQVRAPRQQHSRPSSRPPSRDPPQALGPRPRREPSGRRPGGQPGHEGQTRALLPVEAGDGLIAVKPARCPRGQPPWQGAAPQPQRQHVPEIPAVRPVVTEYQRQRLVCPAWGDAMRPAVPAGVPAGGFGPRVQAITALCAGA
jgi:transposase